MSVREDEDQVALRGGGLRRAMPVDGPGSEVVENLLDDLGLVNDEASY